MFYQKMTDSFFDQKNRESLIYELKEKYPFVKVGTLCKSYCGRDIHYIKLGNEQNEVLMVGGVHGMEWLTSLLLLTFIEKVGFCKSNGLKLHNVDVSSFLGKKGIFVVPCLNPDGTEISIHGSKSAKNYQNLVDAVSRGNTKTWQANARGVDLNHNFDAGWKQLHELEIKNGITCPAPTRYGGKCPESETETRILTELCLKRNFRYAIAFHSQGEEIYWKYGENEPECSFLMGKILSQTSGYKLSSPEGLAGGGGFKDWFIKTFNKPGFTIEIGKGKNPLPISDFDSIYKKLEKMLTISLTL